MCKEPPPEKEIKLLLGGDAVHIRGLFANLENAYDCLLGELKQRERTDGLQKTYWREGPHLRQSQGTAVRSSGERSEPSVTRVKRLPDTVTYPVHAEVIRRLAEVFKVRVEGWWVNHYADGSAAKAMHRDGWGRNRSVNITIGASFGGMRTLRFEAADSKMQPSLYNCVQKDGDVFAFGEKVNRTYKHGVPAEPACGPRISVIIMGEAPADWAQLASTPILMPAVRDQMPNCAEDGSAARCRRRWGQTSDAQRPAAMDLPKKDENVAPRVAGGRWRGRHQVSPWEAHAPNEAYGGSASSKSARACIVWLRDDLRLADNPALHAAIESGCDVILPAFIHDTSDPNPWPIRGAALWWKGESLKAFDASLRTHCLSKLTIRSGDAKEELLGLAREVHADTVYFNRQVEPWYRQRDRSIEADLQAKGIAVTSFKATVLQEPWEGSPSPVVLGDDSAGKGATMFDEVCPGKIVPVDKPWNGSHPAATVTNHTFAQVASIINADRLLSNPNPCAQLLTALGEGEQDGQDHRRRDPDHFLVYRAIEAGEYDTHPLPSVRGRVLAPPAEWPFSLSVEELGYLCTAGHGFPRTGVPQHSKIAVVHRHADAEIEGTASDTPHGDWAAEMRLLWRPGEDAAFLRLRAFVDNIESHKRPDRHRADLRNTSLLSPYLRFGEISARQCYFEAMRAPEHLRHGFIRRVLWRDLSYAELYKWPDMPTVSQRPQYEAEWWSGTHSQLKKWQRGNTGFPLIDAGMRQLWREGYINNYMRHVTAGFLIDYLDISWKEGFAWYDYTLVDSDAAINARLWQQGGHSGISQWNFVMHPVYAAKNADPNGDYVRRWVPEVAGMPTNFIHCPWEAPLDMMAVGVRLGSTYPRRMLLDITAARKQHLRNVLAVRKQHPENQSADGTEYLLLRDGSRVLLRTRDDIRQDTEELVVAQTPDGTLHEKRSAARGKTAALNFQQSLLDQEVSNRVVARGYRDMHIL